MPEPNRVYYAAYLAFRMDAIDASKTGREVAGWDDYAKLANTLEANRNIKRLFPFP